MTDIKIQGEGGLFILHPTTDAGRDWLNEHTAPDAQRWCGGVVCEWRYVDQIVDGAVADGLIIGE